jgi:hypothetical protein
VCNKKKTSETIKQEINLWWPDKTNNPLDYLTWVGSVAFQNFAAARKIENQNYY